MIFFSSQKSKVDGFRHASNLKKPEIQNRVFAPVRAPARAQDGVQTTHVGKSRVLRQLRAGLHARHGVQSFNLTKHHIKCRVCARVLGCRS